MKSKLLMAVLLSAVTACAALSGCAQPADGKSAYDIWLSAGNSGTEVEFIEWLKGQDGKDGVDGQNGTNGKDGKDGKDGKSAYDIWLSAGNSGTEAEFLEWLKGQDGKDGVDGQNGTNGKDGKDGEDGKSAYDIWLSAGNSGTVEEFLDWLKGDADEGTDGLEYYALPDGTYAVGGGTARYMDEVIIPGTHNGKPVTQVADYAFVGDSRGTFACEKIVLPDTIQRIGNNAFEDCRSLVEVNIPDSVDAIGNMAFNNTAVSTIEIPEGVTEIGSNIFNSRVVVRCEAAMKGDGWRSDWIGVDMPVIWNCNYSNTGDDGNTYLIAGGALYKVTDTDAQFLGLSEKTGKNLTIAARFTYDGAAYSVKRIAEAALLNGRIESLTVEEGIEEIGINAFSSCSNLTSVALPDGLKHIESTAFSGCGALEYVILPESLSDIGEYAFEDCYSLDGVYYKGTSALWGEVDVRTGNDELNLANLYFYAASKPQEPATFWHYDQCYNPISWADDGYVMVAFDLNYEDGAAPSQVYVKSGDKLVRPEDPVRENYEFSGWCTDADCTQAYDFTRPVTAEITLYADWGDNLSYVFEAEDVVLDGKYGVGLSGTAGGAMMIQTGTELGASNNLFVGYQYDYGCSISFAIVSDATVSDAKITLRLSAEYRDISIDTQSYLIELNGEPLTYNIEFKDVPSSDGQPIDINTIYAVPFSDYVIAEDVTLREGVNVITLTTNNYDALAGTTMLAAAPLIDCLKIKTSATLEWSEADGYPADNY